MIFVKMMMDRFVYVMVILPTGREGSAGPSVLPDYFLLAQLAQLSHSERRADGSQARTHTTRPESQNVQL